MSPELFLKFHYPELKQLTVTFLTLTSSIFTFSVVFAEKLVSAKPGKRHGQLSLYASWLLFILALIFGGFGLLRLVVAADMAQGGTMVFGDLLYGGKAKDLSDYVLSVYEQLTRAGFSFVGGLILLAVSAFYRIFKQP
jgi:hypothetical protein